jgi:ketosteroid isomerase-like protein
MGLFEDFHHDFPPRFIDAQIAFHDGDAAPNNALWSETDPVTLFAARGLCESGTDRVTETFDRVASEFSAVRDYVWELFASVVSGDLAYTVAIEHDVGSLRGEPPSQQQLRVTHIYRREHGHWRATHPHADRKQPGTRHPVTHPSTRIDP